MTKSVSCKYNKTAVITFGKNIEYSDDFYISVVDEDGVSVDVTILKNTKRRIKIELSDVKDSVIYSGTIYGIKRRNGAEYQNVEFDFYGKVKKEKANKKNNKGRAQ